MRFDWRDALIVIGVLLVGAGLWLRAPWLALTVCGVLIIGLGIAAQAAAGRGGGGGR